MYTVTQNNAYFINKLEERGQFVRSDAEVSAREKSIRVLLQDPLKLYVVWERATDPTRSSYGVCLKNVREPFTVQKSTCLAGYIQFLLEQHRLILTPEELEDAQMLVRNHGRDMDCEEKIKIYTDFYHSVMGRSLNIEIVSLRELTKSGIEEYGLVAEVFNPDILMWPVTAPMQYQITADQVRKLVVRLKN